MNLFYRDVVLRLRLRGQEKRSDAVISAVLW